MELLPDLPMEARLCVYAPLGRPIIAGAFEAVLTSATRRADAPAMKVSAIVMRRAHLFSQAAVACARARILYAEACIQRDVLRALVQRGAARRIARLAARGERDGTQVPKSGDGLEVVEQLVCPHCRRGAIMPDGRVTAAHGLIKTRYRCDACERSFVSVRQARE